MQSYHQQRIILLAAFVRFTQLIVASTLTLARRGWDNSQDAHGVTVPCAETLELRDYAGFAERDRYGQYGKTGE
jgi:hypothetical protein